MDANKKSNKRYSKYHPTRPCSKCILCGTFKSNTYYSHYAAWGDNEKDFLQQHLDFQPDPSSCICIAHLKEAQRTHAQGYIPTWKRSLKAVEPSIKIKHCIYPSCSSSSKLITPSFASIDDLEALLQVQSSKEHPLVLCTKHYHELYHRFNSPLPCASCGAQPKAGTCFTRHSPNASLVNKLLRCTELGDTINDEDYICSSCYKSHLALIKSYEDESMSSDMHLSDLIAIWECKISDNDTDKLTRAVLHTATHVARELLNQRAVLLPHISRIFLHTYGHSTPDSDEQLLEGREGTIKFSSRWLLKQLIMYLCNHMEYKCVHKKFGTVLFRKGGDMLSSLSWALGRAGTESEPLYEHKSGQSHTTENATHILIEAGDILNDLIHKEIRKISDEGISDPTYFNIEKEIGEIDPLLWTFIESITRTVRQRQGEVEENRHVKTLRRYYILCLLMYCTNTQRPTLLHTLLADTVEICGGSRKLLKVLNQFGAVSSSDTHDRFVTDVATRQRNKTVWDDLSDVVFTLASVDNFDMLQSNATVYCGDQQRSYHGTTVQLVQPNPRLLVNTETVVQTNITTSSSGEITQDTEMLTTATQTSDIPPTKSVVSLKRKCGQSPASLPHNLGKVGPKRPRTIKPRKLAEQLQTTCVNESSSTCTSNVLNSIPDASTVTSSTPTANPPSSDTSTSSASHTCCIAGPGTVKPNMQGFMEGANEIKERETLQSKLFAYMLAKHQISSKESKILQNFKEMYAQSTCSKYETKQSNIYYMELVDENPDSTETMTYVSELLLQTTATVHQDSYIVLIGDGKTYEHLMEVKRLYGSTLNKLLIFPGDWHTLANFQPVLIKIYYHAGLKEIAQRSGYKGETLTSLEKCSSFKRNHQFLLQVWEAMYRAMIHAFHTNNPNLHELLIHPHMTTSNMLESLSSFIKDAGTQCSFQAYVSSMSVKDDTWKFWQQFVFQDCFAYVQLYLAIRCQNWDLRVSALKLMAPLFIAYDRTTYQRLIPNHLADIQVYPQKILNCLKKGFTVSIRGTKGHAVAIDEAHEMLINKDMKFAITRPTKAYLQKTSLFLRYRITAHHNLIDQVFPKLNCRTQNLNGIFNKTPEGKQMEENICTMIREIKDYALFPTPPTTNRGLVNVFSGIKASSEQHHDLMNFRNIGEDHLRYFIAYHILKQASTNAPVRKNRLLTMATKKKVSKRQIDQKEKEMKQVTKCLRQRLAWCNRTGQPYNPASEQYSPLPRAIADEKGYPHKGSKATWKDKLKKRYSTSTEPVVMDSIPQGWKPEIVIIDAMFLINCKPLRNTTTIKDYSLLLFNRFILPHYQALVKEVHLIFDTSHHHTFNPKEFEQKRRDHCHDSKTHNHISFTPTTNIPIDWRAFIDCRQCKRSIIEAIGMSYMQVGRFSLRSDQVLILSGCFSGLPTNPAFCIQGNGSLPTPDPRYTTNSEEADMRIWRHATQSTAQRVLIYSPDTDIYNIGLPLVAMERSKEVIVQLNVPQSQTLIYLHMNNLIKALELDPDLASLPRHKLESIFQMLYICSGCDYVSYFSGLGKSVFFNVFFQHASFITGHKMCGSLSDISDNTRDMGFLAFIRLIGTLYFKKHYSAMVSLKGVETPQQLFNSKPCTSINEQHRLWYNEIRTIVGDRITCEVERMPSHTSMWRHWLRSCWVAQMWQNSCKEDLFHTLPTPESSGWKIQEDGTYTFDWECPETQKEIEETINFLTKGCSCKTGCQSNRCGCKKKGNYCGPGCSCQSCQNLPITNTGASATSVQEQLSSAMSSASQSEDDSSSTESSDESNDEDSNIITDIVTDTFDEYVIDMPI